jgi:hypothetical protein
MFFTNVFSYSSRERVCDHAYRSTLADLGARRAELAPLLARHGLRLRQEVLDSDDASLTGGLPTERPRRRRTEATARLRRALDDVDLLVAARRGRRRPARGAR